MIYNIEWLKDSVGNRYLGISIPKYLVEPYLKTLRELVDSDDEYNLLLQNQKSRDDDKYHITVFNVMDVHQVIKKQGFEGSTSIFDSLTNVKLNDLEFKGIGKAEKSGNIAYFIVVKSNHLQTIRNNYQFQPLDLHITLGFNKKDVHGVSKKETLKINTPFIKLFKNLFYNTPNLSALRLISNFDKNLKGDVIPLELNQNYIKVYCDGYFMQIGEVNYDHDSSLLVMSQWKDENDSFSKMNKLTQTEITKFIKHNYE